MKDDSIEQYVDQSAKIYYTGKNYHFLHTIRFHIVHSSIQTVSGYSKKDGATADGKVGVLFKMCETLTENCSKLVKLSKTLRKKRKNKTKQGNLAQSSVLFLLNST